MLLRDIYNLLITALSFKTYNRVSKKTTLSRKVGDFRLLVTQGKHIVRHPEIETSTYNEPGRGSVCENITKHKASTTDRTSPMCECGWRYSVTAWRTYVLIRCYLQPSLAEAPGCGNFTGTDGKMFSENL